MHKCVLTALLSCTILLGASPSAFASDTRCTMRFDLSGWSVFYKSATGNGTIRCDNGQNMRVQLRVRGGGLSFGKTTIEDGRGEFSAVRDISDLLGAYVSGEAHAGAVKSATSQVMTKGPVSMALSGTGRGWDVGVAFGRFTIQRAR